MVKKLRGPIALPIDLISPSGLDNSNASKRKIHRGIIGGARLFCQFGLGQSEV
jgi:hypothetical protein